MKTNFNHYICEQFPDDCLVSIASSKSSSMQHGVHFVNKGPIKSKNGRYSSVSLPRRLTSNQDIFPAYTW